MSRGASRPARVALTDLAIRLAIAPLFDHLCLNDRWQGLLAGFRARRANLESGHAFSAEAMQPLKGGADAEAASLRGFFKA